MYNLDNNVNIMSQYSSHYRGILIPRTFYQRLDIHSINCHFNFSQITVKEIGKFLPLAHFVTKLSMLIISGRMLKT